MLFMFLVQTTGTWHKFNIRYYTVYILYIVYRLYNNVYWIVSSACGTDLSHCSEKTFKKIQLWWS